jgi:hypothetical protein
MKKRLPVEDVDPESERLMIEELRAMPAWKKIQIACQLTEEYRERVKNRLRRRYPNASEHEIKMRAAVEFLGRETVKEVYGWESYDE